MKTQYYAASSLDGFIADRENSLDWLMQFGEDDGTSYPAFIRDVGLRSPWGRPPTNGSSAA